MEKVREFLQKPIALVGGGFLVGLIIGWFVIGWGIWPVKWTDASVKQLRQDLKMEYLKMAVDSYVLNKDAALAQKRFKEMGKEGEQLLAEMENEFPEIAANIATFRLAVMGAATTPQGTESVTLTTPEASASAPEAGLLSTPEPTTKSSPLNVLRSIFIVLCVATVVIVIGLVAILFLRSRKTGGKTSTKTASIPAAQPHPGWESKPVPTPSEEPPMMQFMASYKFGDDLFDDSFSIDSQSGEFLGECGVSISETIGVGDPKKVTAFEVWLFDKNDIQTITKVLMSEHAYNDEAIQQRLAAKGEPVLVQPGIETVLESQTLQLVVRVVEMGYGDGALPPQSYFDHLILELAVWSKA
ncbi:MAG: hypothetical protein ACPL4H_01800 [Anaerolineales bacterium]